METQYKKGKISFTLQFYLQWLHKFREIPMPDGSIKKMKKRFTH